MLEKIAKQTGAEIAEQISGVIESKMNPKKEWHKFRCELNHTFAVEINTGISTRKIIEFYDTMICPMCQSTELTKEKNL